MEKLPWWNEEQAKFADEVEDFIDEEILPRALEMGPKEQRRIQWEISNYIAERGYSPLRILLGNEYDGPDVGYTGYCILLEELGRSFLNVCPLLTSVFVGWPVHLFGSDSQKEEFLEPLVRGEKWAATAVTEPDAGSDATNIQLYSEKDDDHYVLNGWKRFVTLGGSADSFMVYCLADPSPEARRINRHLNAFFVPSSTSGITVEKTFDLCGDPPELDLSLLRFKDVRVPKENMIMDEGDGWMVMTSAINIERLGISSVIGQAKIVIETAKAYARRRVQFGERINDFQLVQSKIADMVTKYNLSRVYLYYLANLLDSGKVDMFRMGVKASMLKVFSTEALVDICKEGSMILGGASTVREFGLGDIIGNSFIQRIGAGANDLLKLFIGRTESRKDIDERLLPSILRGTSGKKEE